MASNLVVFLLVGRSSQKLNKPKSSQETYFSQFNGYYFTGDGCKRDKDQSVATLSLFAFSLGQKAAFPRPNRRSGTAEVTKCLSTLDVVNRTATAFQDGFYWLTGRMDDVINVSGHRIGTAEVESALVAHAKVAEAAVVGFPHEVKGEFCPIWQPVHDPANKRHTNLWFVHFKDVGKQSML